MDLNKTLTHTHMVNHLNMMAMVFVICGYCLYIRMNMIFY